MAHVGFLCLIDLFIKLSIYFYKNPDNTEVLQNPKFHVIPINRLLSWDKPLYFSGLPLLHTPL